MSQFAIQPCGKLRLGFVGTQSFKMRPAFDALLHCIKDLSSYRTMHLFGQCHHILEEKLCISQSRTQTICHVSRHLFSGLRYPIAIAIHHPSHIS